MDFFFGRKSKTAESVGGTSTATWQSLTGNSTEIKHFDTQQPDGDGSGFLHPESTMERNLAYRSSEWDKERSAQQLELSDVHDKSTVGCCQRFLEFLIKLLHVIDFAASIALIVYGSLMDTQFENPAMAAVAFCLILGTLHLITSLLGIISYVSSSCRRIGLVASAFFGPYMAVTYLIMVVALAITSSGFYQYLEDNKDVMYVKDVENVERLMPLIEALLVCLSFLETARFCVVYKIKARLAQHDSNDILIPSSSPYGRSEAASPNASMTEALLEDQVESEAVSTGGASRSTSEKPIWWDS